ncbi:hypothetical protein FACS1894130_00140 [Spirochaetia bacterium]|nr:hypothetical protein FACS1894130_00140 [Spirochaetia bacterium]
MANNIVSGNETTAEGLAVHFVAGAAMYAGGEVLGKLGEVAKTVINKPQTTYMQNTNTESVAPLNVNFKATNETVKATE